MRGGARQPLPLTEHSKPLRGQNGLRCLRTQPSVSSRSPLFSRIRHPHPHPHPRACTPSSPNPQSVRVASACWELARRLPQRGRMQVHSRPWKFVAPDPLGGGGARSLKRPSGTRSTTAQQARSTQSTTIERP